MAACLPTNGGAETGEGRRRSGGALNALLRVLLDGVAAYERVLIRGRTKAALAALKAQGRRVGGVPLGWRLAAGGLLAVDPAEQTTIATLRALRASGLSVRAVLTEAIRLGLDGRTGRPFTLVIRHATVCLSRTEVLLAALREAFLARRLMLPDEQPAASAPVSAPSPAEFAAWTGAHQNAVLATLDRLAAGSSGGWVDAAQLLRKSHLPDAAGQTTLEALERTADLAWSHASGEGEGRVRRPPPHPAGPALPPATRLTPRRPKTAGKAKPASRKPAKGRQG